MSPQQIDRSRLEEIDGRLRAIQERLLQDSQAAAVAPPGPAVGPPPLAAAPGAQRLIAELRELTDRQERLLGELRALLGYAQRAPSQTP